jgi:Putative MetA-pathway of phenol degradation
MAKDNGALRSFREKRAALLLLFALALLTSTATVARAQRLIAPLTDTLPPATQQAGEEEEDFIKPGRPGVASPAEIQKAGVLQLEYGYDANFRAEEFRTQQAAPLSLRFAATERFLLEASLDTVISETDESGTRMTGVGDTRLGFQIVALKDTERHPALAFAYYVKLPSASEEKGLGTGRFDHKFITLISKKFGSVDMDLNGAVLVVGREDASGWITGGQGALSFSGEFENGFGLEGELSGQTKDDVQPKGLYALGAITYKVNRRFRLDGGVRFGLTEDSPRVGVFAGITVGVAELYRKKP